jgi:hypothetical protein
VSVIGCQWDHKRPSPLRHVGAGSKFERPKCYLSLLADDFVPTGNWELTLATSLLPALLDLLGWTCHLGVF